MLFKDDFHEVGGWDLTGMKWIEKVATTTDSDLRAHRIALTYYAFATKLDDELYGDGSVRNSWKWSRSPSDVNANWFHFAMWGTLTVSQNIAPSRTPQRLNTGFASSFRRALTPAVAQVRAADGQVLGRALSWGQRLIFASACVAMRRRFLDRKKGKVRLVVDKGDYTKDATLIKKLCEWDGNPYVRLDRHVAVVQQAFEWLDLARNASADDKARLILGSTVLLTAVEQDLVDPALAIVVNLLPARLTSALERRVASLAARRRDVPTQLTELVLARRYASQRQLLDTVWSRLMTDQVLVMALPAETLRLGRDVPFRRHGEPFYPKHLRDFTPPDPPDKSARGKALAEIARLVASLDRTVGDGRGSAAHDWRRWDERMNWAVTLFRSRQTDVTLFWPPYSRSDQQRIVAGELPLREADPSALEVLAPIDGSVFMKGYGG